MSEDQRFLLQQLLSHGKAPVRQQAHARILLMIPSTTAPIHKREHAPWMESKRLISSPCLAVLVLLDKRGFPLRLLAGRMVEPGYVEHVSHETVRQVLKKTN